MGIFSHSTTEPYMESTDIVNESSSAFLEQVIFDEVSQLSDATREAFLESSECKALEEAGILKKRTIMRLSKLDDLTRRSSMMAVQLAKEAKDPLYKKLVIVQVKRRELLEKIETKYGNKAHKAAAIAQKEYLKNKLPIAFMRK